MGINSSSHLIPYLRTLKLSEAVFLKSALSLDPVCTEPQIAILKCKLVDGLEGHGDTRYKYEKAAHPTCWGHKACFPPVEVRILSISIKNKNLLVLLWVLKKVIGQPCNKINYSAMISSLNAQVTATSYLFWL